MSDWGFVAVGIILVLTGIACLAYLAHCVGRDAGRSMAAMYWAGKGDHEQAKRSLRGERPREDDRV